MTQHLSDDEILKMARERVEAKKGFFIHLGMYIIVNIFIVVIWFLTTGGRGYPWFLWVLCGWGIGVVANALAVFLGGKGSSWERRELQKEIDRLKKV
jgi:2TM domain